MNKVMVLYTSVSVFLFFSLALVLPSGYSYGPALLFLGIFLLPFFKNEKQAQLVNHQVYFIAILFIFYFFISMFSVIYHDLPLRSLDKPSKFILSLVPLYILLKYPPKINYFWIGIIIGGILTGLLFFYQKFVLHLDRPNGFLNQIQSGNISILFSFFCLVGLIWIQNRARYFWWKSGFILAFSLALSASILSESRGGWLALPPAIFLLLWSHRSVIFIKKNFMLLGFSLFIFIGLYSSPETGIKKRMEQVFTDISNYQSGDKFSPTGIRIELWKSAVLLSVEYPILGYGQEKYLLAMKEKVDKGEVPKYLNFGHVHNDYLDSLVKQGLIGLLALLLLYLLPLKYFLKYVSHASNNVKSLALCGSILILSYSIFSLTQSFLMHNSGVMVFIFTLLIVFSLLRNELKMIVK